MTSENPDERMPIETLSNLISLSLINTNVITDRQPTRAQARYRFHKSTQ